MLPEGVLARDITDPDIVKRSAQPLDGPFLSALLPATQGLTVFFCVHVPAADGKVWNTQVALRDGRIIAQYRKLHLYDAFNMQESLNVRAGAEIPPLVEVAGLKVGMLTCYDLRFPELPRRLALDGADLLVAPSAWVRGPLKEMHWQVLSQARALENTCYVVAVGECGPRNIGASMAIDPLGVIIARAAETDAWSLPTSMRAPGPGAPDPARTAEPPLRAPRTGRLNLPPPARPAATAPPGQPLKACINPAFRKVE